MNRLGHIIFYVQDIEKTVSFYEKAFGVSRAFIDPTGQYAQMATGETALAFATWDLAKENLSQKFRAISTKELPGCEISFIAKDVHQSVNKAVKEGAELIASPEAKPWGQTIAYVRDFNGILIEIGSEMAACPEEECSTCCQ